MEKYYTIAGYGKYKYVKRVSSKKARELEDKNKFVTESYDRAKEELAEMKR